jgi:hypothetical protein
MLDQRESCNANIQFKETESNIASALSLQFANLLGKIILLFGWR